MEKWFISSMKWVRMFASFYCNVRRYYEFHLPKKEALVEIIFCCKANKESTKRVYLCVLQIKRRHKRATIYNIDFQFDKALFLSGIVLRIPGCHGKYHHILDPIWRILIDHLNSKTTNHLSIRQFYSHKTDVHNVHWIVLILMKGLNSTLITNDLR